MVLLLKKQKFLMTPFLTLLGQRMKPQAQSRKPKKDKRKRDWRAHQAQKWPKHIKKVEAHEKELQQNGPRNWTKPKRPKNFDIKDWRLWALSKIKGKKEGRARARARATEHKEGTWASNLVMGIKRRKEKSMSCYFASQIRRNKN